MITEHIQTIHIIKDNEKKFNPIFHHQCHAHIDDEKIFEVHL